MTPLDDTQLEDILEGRSSVPKDIDATDERQLRHMYALRVKMRGAFASVRARPEFADRLRRAVLRDSPQAAPRAAGRRGARFWQVGVPLAAAAMLILGIVLALPSSSAQARLAELHHQMISEPDAVGFHAEGNPVLLKRYLSKKSQTDVQVFCCDCASVKGGCTTVFFGEEVPGYLLEREGKKLTVVATRRTPEEMKLSHRFERNGREVWTCRGGPCNIAAVRLDDRTYCVIGEAEHEVLLVVVDAMIRASQGEPAACTSDAAAVAAGV